MARALQRAVRMTPIGRRLGARVLVAGLVLLAAGTAASAAGDSAAAKLPEKYRKWLEEVALLITKPERTAFLALDQDYERDGFIERFWEARDPYPETVLNEFRVAWENRLAYAREHYGNITEDRARVLLLHGEPADLLHADCALMLWPLEIWHYGPGADLGRDFLLLFYQPAGGGPFYLWQRAEGFRVLLAMNGNELQSDSEFEFRRAVLRHCPNDAPLVLRAMDTVLLEDKFHQIERAQRGRPPRDSEWLTTFRNASTDVAAAAPALAATLDVGFPEADGPRTVVRGTIGVSTAGLTAQVLGERRGYELELNGEVLREGALFETFRYRFDLPVGEAPPPTLALEFERKLRPGEYRLVLRVEEPASRRAWRVERPLVVPRLEAASAAAGVAPAPSASSPAAVALPAAAAAVVKLVPPKETRISGPVRFEATVEGEGVARVVFELDGKVMLERARPPWSVELNLGAAPSAREVRAVAYDAQGRELGSDVLLLNAARQAFTVRLLEPRSGAAVAGSVRVRVEARVPEEASLERIEIFSGDNRVATLYQAPWAVSVPVDAGKGPAILRAVGYLADGQAAEDTVLVNSPGEQTRLDVRLVELYAAVEDAAGRPVTGLDKQDFRILEQGREQEVVRCERVADLPLRVVLALDTSASMSAALDSARQAALRFVDRVLTPRDRVALVSFSDQPRLEQPFTAEAAALGASLARLRADRGTALWDAAIYSLDMLRGTRGQAAVLLLTDGGDRMSKVRFEDALDFARRSGVAVYSIGLGVSRLELGERQRLCKLAEQTGGRCIFAGPGAELDAAYAQIEQELRGRYLLVYQPPTAPAPGEFRPIEVQVRGAGRKVRVASGYAP